MRFQHHPSLRSLSSLRTLLSFVAGALVVVAAPNVARADLGPGRGQVSEPTPEPEKVFSEKDRVICNGKTLGDECISQSGGAGTCQSRACNKTIPSGDAGPTFLRGTCVVCADLSNDRALILGGELGGGSCAATTPSTTGSGLGVIGFLGLALVVRSFRHRRRHSS